MENYKEVITTPGREVISRESENITKSDPKSEK